MIAENTENTQRKNSIGFSKNNSITGAVVNMKKLLKSVKRIFSHSKSEKNTTDEIIGIPSYRSEEELENWLNEQLEAEQIALQ